MANQDYLTINGSQVNLTTYDVALDRCTTFVRGGTPELVFSRVLLKLTTLPDPWSGKSCAWSNGSSYPGTTYFTGDVVGYSDRYDTQLGWVREYRALGLRDRADWVPVTDSNTFSDTCLYNMPANTPSTIPSREGRTMGQIVLDVLSMAQNVAALAAQGIGNFTSAGSGGQGTAVLGGTRGWQVTSISVAAPGSGYTVAPTVVVAGGGGSGASYTATVSGGQITGFVQVSAGSGYLTQPAVIISTLPAATVTDLLALNVIAPFAVSIAGERMMQNIESVIQTCHPNHSVFILGDNIGSNVIGTIRVLDQRLFTNNTITLNSTTTEPDGTIGMRWLMPQLNRDMADCYSQLIVRGGLQTGAVTLGVKQWPGSSLTYTWAPSGAGAIPSGGLLPDFAGWGGYTTNAAAEAAWSPAMFATLSLQTGQDQGSCTCPSTTTVTITSQNTSEAFAANALDQTNTGLHATITVVNDSIPGLQQMFSARVISNTAMIAGGTATLTLDQAMPATTYNSYRLTALSSAGNVVGRRYKVMNPTIAAAMQQYFPYPFAFRNSDGTAATLTSAPVCTVYWSASGSPPYNQATIGVQIDPVAGTITTVSPTSLVFGGGIVTPPSDVQVFVPVATGLLNTTYPLSGYGGTLYTVEGIQRTKTITVREWVDYSLNTNMALYASELFTSLCDVVLEGTMSYLGLPVTYLTPGQAVSIAGNGFTTGYETIANTGGNNGIAVASVDVQFQPGPFGTSYISTLHLSNRKQRYTGDVFVRPPIIGQQIGLATAGGNWQSYQGMPGDGIAVGPGVDTSATLGAFGGEEDNLAVPAGFSLDSGPPDKQVSHMRGSEFKDELLRRAGFGQGGEGGGE
jgi:hypothetical protein